MRKFFTLAVLVFLVIFSQKNYAQTFELDMISQDFNIEFPIEEYDFPDTNQEARIYFLNNLEGYPAEWDDGKIILSHPSKLWLNAGGSYTCRAKYFNIFGEEKYTKNFSFIVPTVDITLDWGIENGLLKTTAIIDNDLCLLIDKINTRFFLYNHSGKIGEDFKITKEFFFPKDYSSKIFEGEYSLSQAKPGLDKGLAFGIDFVDRLGNKRIQAENHIDIDFTENQLIVGPNIALVGAINPFFGYGEEVEAEVLDVSGRTVTRFLLKSSEGFWPSSYFNGSGMYILKVEGIGEVKFLKFE